jgi:hypothetical protein
MIRVRAIVILAASVSPALADTVTCSMFAGVRTCSSPSGYVSHESTWNGITTGDDNQGNRWSTSRWRGDERTTITPPER